MGFELLKRLHAVVVESRAVLDVSTAFDSASRSIAQSLGQACERVTFSTRATFYVVLAYTRAAAFDAPKLMFPVRAERTALADLARPPLSLVLAHTRAAAIDALIRPFPVLAFLANPGLCHACTGTATARDEQPRC